MLTFISLGTQRPFLKENHQILVSKLLLMLQSFFAVMVVHVHFQVIRAISLSKSLFISFLLNASFHGAKFLITFCAIRRFDFSNLFKQGA